MDIKIISGIIITDGLYKLGVRIGARPGDGVGDGDDRPYAVNEL